jgi:hypothetical protein
MKYLFSSAIIFLFSFQIYAQTESENFKYKELSNRFLSIKEFKKDLIKYDFSRLLLNTDNSIVYGFIGNNYQRIRVKIISITKDTLTLDSYHVYGKSMVIGDIDEFNGTIKITHIKKFNPRLHGCEDEYKYKGYKGEFILLGDYNFQENPAQNHSGIFKGAFRSDFFIDKKNQIRYNDIENCSDSYTNNQFIGQWISYKGSLSKRCNWGDFRAPNSDDLDIGAGEFSPSDKYLKYGWQSVRDQNNKIENFKWWK